MWRCSSRWPRSSQSLYQRNAALRRKNAPITQKDSRSVRPPDIASSPALAIPTIQARRTPIHHDDGVRVALVAHRGAGREGEGWLFCARFGFGLLRGLAEDAGEVVREGFGIALGAYVRFFF